MSLTFVPGLVLAQDDASVGYDLWMRARAPGIVTDPYTRARCRAPRRSVRDDARPDGDRDHADAAARDGPGARVYVGVVVCEPDGVERVYRFHADDDGTSPEGPPRRAAPPDPSRPAVDSSSLWLRVIRDREDRSA